MSAVILILFLAYVAVRLPADTFWNPLEGVRYYSEFVPAMAVLWLLVLSAALTPPLNRRLAAAAGVIVAIAIVVECRFVFRGTLKSVRTAASASDAPAPGSPEAVVRARLAAMPGVPHRVVDSALGCLKDLRWKGEVRTYPIDDAYKLADTFASQPTYVIVVVRWKPTRDGGRDEQFDTRRALEWCRFFGLKIVDEARDSENVCDIYGGLVPVYRAGETPSQLAPAEPARP